MGVDEKGRCVAIIFVSAVLLVTGVGQEGGIMDPTRSMLSQAQQQQLQQQHLQQGVQQASQSATKPSTGTISGMLADFSRALGRFPFIV
uniref:Uncharacterized protein n=1 Tax=Timema cristinae TaxID=61476 RepID=A0A7R9CES5_TIMCR|nr:unnamed protein product [Timema cristinae]